METPGYADVSPAYGKVKVPKELMSYDRCRLAY
jgi:hypothetical protein